MIPFVVATSLTTYSTVYLENEDRIAENVPLFVKKFLWKEHLKRKKEKVRDSNFTKIYSEKKLCNMN